MKNLGLIFLSIFIVFSINAQESDTTKLDFKSTIVLIIKKPDSTNTDTVDIKFGEKEDEKFNGHWAGFEIGLNTYFKDLSMSPNDDYDFLELNTGKSWGVNLNFVEKNINLYKNKIGLVTGLGLEINNYRFNNNINLVTDSSAITYYTDTVLDYEKNKLTATYLTIPLLLEFQFPVGHNTLFFSTGVIGGMKLGSHTKKVYIENNKKFKDKIREDFHLSPFRYGITAKIGYGGLNLFATYSLSTLFEKNEGPELYPFIAGLAISF